MSTSSLPEESVGGTLPWAFGFFPCSECSAPVHEWLFPCAKFAGRRHEVEKTIPGEFFDAVWDISIEGIAAGSVSIICFFCFVCTHGSGA